MKVVRSSVVLAPVVFSLVLFAVQACVDGAKVTVDLGDSRGVTTVGVLRRWDQDGNHRRPVDPKARIDAPVLEATAAAVGGNRWIFADLPPGKYDLLIMGRDPAKKGPFRIEGWEYAPVLEFDPFFPARAATDQQTRKFVTDHIQKSRHFENKVVPLYMGGDKQAVRVLVMLIRDKPTSYKPGVGTIRHEIWQYTYKYGGWQKEKRTKVIDRILLQVSQLRRWTWLWDARLGGIEVKDSPVTVEYQLPKRSDEKKLKGLYPY